MSVIEGTWIIDFFGIVLWPQFFSKVRGNIFPIKDLNKLLHLNNFTKLNTDFPQILCSSRRREQPSHIQHTYSRLWRTSGRINSSLRWNYRQLWRPGKQRCKRATVWNCSYILWNTVINTWKSKTVTLNVIINWYIHTNQIQMILQKNHYWNK